MRSSYVLLAVVLASFTGELIVACSSDETPNGASVTDDASTDSGSTTGNDGGVDDNNDSGSPPSDADGNAPDANDGGADGAACVGPIVTTTNGETCIGFGPMPDSCDPACGQPYGYVCVNGGPPGFTGCREQSSNGALGSTFCCQKNDCVAQPDQDTQCNGSAGKPHRYQCPPTSSSPDAGFATPKAGCVENGSGATQLEKFYCCP